MTRISESCSLIQNYKSQQNALTGVAVLVVGGLQIGWNFVIFDFFSERTWYMQPALVVFAYASFYIFGIIGLLIAAKSISRVSKNIIYYTTLAFVTGASALLIIKPINYYAVLIARSMIGLAFGCAYLTTIVHASEIVNQKIRGMAIGSFQLTIMIAAYVGSMMRSYIGIIGAVVGGSGFICVYFFTKESPVKMMQEKKFEQALSIMTRLRKETSENPALRNDYNELKTMVEEDEQTSKNIFKDGNLKPLILILLLKIAFVLSLNLGLNFIKVTSLSYLLSDSDLFTLFNLSMSIVIRLLTMSISMYSIDLVGRKIHFVVSHLGTGIVLCTFGILSINKSDNSRYSFDIIQIILEVLGGIGIGTITDVYTSEAFNSIKKTDSIFFVTTVEFLLHIAIIYFVFYTPPYQYFVPTYLMTSGVILVIITVILYINLPETKQMSIRQTRNAFLKRGEVISLGLNRAPRFGEIKQ